MIRAGPSIHQDDHDAGHWMASEEHGGRVARWTLCSKFRSFDAFHLIKVDKIGQTVLPLGTLKVSPFSSYYQKK